MKKSGQVFTFNINGIVYIANRNLAINVNSLVGVHAPSLVKHGVGRIHGKHTSKAHSGSTVQKICQEVVTCKHTVG